MGLQGPGRSGGAFAFGRCEGYAHTKVGGAGRRLGGRRGRREQVQARAASLGHGGDTGGKPVLVKGVPCAPSWARLGLGPGGVHGLDISDVKKPRTNGQRRAAYVLRS